MSNPELGQPGNIFILKPGYSEFRFGIRKKLRLPTRKISGHPTCSPEKIRNTEKLASSGKIAKYPTISWTGAGTRNSAGNLTVYCLYLCSYSASHHNLGALTILPDQYIKLDQCCTRKCILTKYQSFCNAVSLTLNPCRYIY